MNRKSSQQTYIHPDLSLNNKNTHRPLLEQTLPKYRKQILERNLDNCTKDLTSRVKEKYRNFGEEDFIKKLKYNSTRQIDRKSIKVIDKYLHELNKQKNQPMGYLHRTTSMKGLNTLNENILNNQNEQSIQSPKVKFNKNISLSMIPSTMNTQSEQTVNIHKVNQNFKGKNKEQTQQQNISESEDQGIRESGKFRENESQKWGNKNNSGSRERNFINIMSFRNNFDGNQSGVSLSKELKPASKQFSGKNKQEQKSIGFLMSENNFYHKFPSPNTKAPNIHNKFIKERPTVDTQMKKKELSQGQKYMQTNNSIFMEEQLRILREKNEEQQEIIKLQEIMIEKLNVQLQNVLEKLQEKQEIHKPQKSFEDFQVNQLRNILDTNEVNNSPQSLTCLKINEKFKDQVQNATQEWQKGFNRLKNLLQQMQFYQNEQFKEQYLCQPFQVKQFNDCQDELNVNQSGDQNQRINLSSANFFYHLPTRPSSSFGVTYSKKQRQSSELSNFYTLSIEPERKGLEYSAGSDFQFDLIEEKGVKEE